MKDYEQVFIDGTWVNPQGGDTTKPTMGHIWAI